MHFELFFLTVAIALFTLLFYFFILLAPTLHTGPLDLVFGAPSTTELGENGLNDYKSFRKRVTKSFLFSNRESRVGIIQLSCPPAVILQLSQGNTMNKVFQSIDSIPFKPGVQDISKLYS